MSEKASKWDWVKRTTWISVALFSIIGMIVGAMNYFARAYTVNLLDRRLELSIEDDRVFQAEQDLTWHRQQTAFERRKQPKTEAETEMIDRAQDHLAQLKERRQQKQRAYEQAK